MTQLSGCIVLIDNILYPSILYFRITVRHPFQRWVKLVVGFCSFLMIILPKWNVWSVSEGYCQHSEISWRDAPLSLTALSRRTGKVLSQSRWRSVMCALCPGTTADRGRGLPRNTGQRLSVTSVRTSSQQSAVINCKIRRIWLLPIIFP